MLAVMDVSHVLATAHSAAVRRAAALRFLAECGPLAEVLVVTPTRAAGRRLVLEAARERARFGIRVRTLGVAAGERALPILAQQGRTPISGVGREAVATQVLERLAAAGELGPLADVADLPGLPGALVRTLDELRLAGWDEATPIPTEGAVALLHRLALAYRDELEREGLVDRAEVLRAALERGGAAWDAALFLDVPLPHDLEARWLGRLAEGAARALVLAPPTDERSLRALAAGGFEPQPLEDPPGSELGALQRGLFVADAPTFAGERDGSVRLLSAPGEARECVEIARDLIRRAEGGLPFDRAAIVVRDPHRYRPHLVEALRRASIPARFHSGLTRPDPGGRALLALLDCVAERFSARAFGEYLSLAVVPGLEEDGGPPPAAADTWVAPEDALFPFEDFEADDPWDVSEPDAVSAVAPAVAGSLRVPRRWEQLIVDAAVVGGRDRWLRRLRGLEREVDLALSRAADEAHEDRVGRLEQRREDLVRLREFALPLLDELAGLPEVASWGEWIDALGALATRALRQPERVLQVLAELGPMREVGGARLEQVRRALAPRLMELRVLPPRDQTGVEVLSTDEVRGRSFEVVYVLGLAEKIFPATVAPDPLLRDEAREAWRESGGPPLRTRGERALEERLALQLAVGAAEKAVVLSWPRLDVDRSRPRVPSFYVLEAARLIRGHLPSLEELGAEAKAGVPSLRWPAPRDPDESIDLVERDLATMRRPLVGRGEAGSLAHLPATNAHLARALRSRIRRWDSPASWTVADGLVDVGPAGRELLERHDPSARPYSATALQRVATCPYQFYLNQLLRLEPREVPEAIEELDALQRGSLVHDIQFAVLTRLRDEKMLPLDHPQRLTRAREVLTQEAARIGASYEEELAPAIPRVWADGLAEIAADLGEWIARLHEESVHWTPTHFELAFGLRAGDDRDEASRAEPVALDEGILLRGAIDMVETSEGRLRATDHKTGKASKGKGLVIDGGRTLQPALYALALEKLFPSADVAGGSLFFCTSRGGFERRDVALDGEARRSVAMVTEVVRSLLKSSFLAAHPVGAWACQWCDYASVCGPHEHARVGTKTRAPEALGQLVGLRRMK